VHRPRPRARRASPRPVLIGLLLSVAVALDLGAPRPAAAFVRFDFEQAYYVHPGRQVWDFSVTRPDSVYHIFYHTIHEMTPHSSYADTIWHATSPDLVHWDAPVPVVFSGTAAWDTSAVWAPDVFRDEANGRWGLAYTGAGAGMNQRLGLAFSSDLAAWSSAANPVLAPDSAVYQWSLTGTWSDFRDPFLWRDADTWHVLLTAKQPGVGVIFHAVSPDLAACEDVGPLFANDGPTPARVLESVQYHRFGTHHHLLFGEFNTAGISHVSATDLADLTMATRKIIDDGYAPELDSFDPDVHVLSRITPFVSYDPGLISYVVRFDTLHVSPDSTEFVVHKPHPLDARWEVHVGTAAVAAPTFGDNPVWRSEPSVGLVGNGYLGTAEFYQGPLSGLGAPGALLGGGATCRLDSRPFAVTGDSISLLVGGGDDPANLYVALVDAVADTILLRETGDGEPLLKPRRWHVRPYKGMTCRIRIVDDSTADDGFLNVDEIVEFAGDELAAAPRLANTPAPPRAVPSPSNPRTEIRYDLAEPARVAVEIFDLRGRRVWRSAERREQAGQVRIAWDGRDDGGRAAAAGTYLFRVLLDDRPTGLGKLVIVR